MKSREDLLKDAYQLAEENIPTCPQHIHIAYQKGEELCHIYHANSFIVLVGLYLMDVKLNEARKTGDRSKHVAMASSFAKEFLKNYHITEDEVQQIIHCIEAHHGTIPFLSKEAEICANADCYRFIHPLGVFSYFGFLSQKLDLVEDRIKKVCLKMEEKYQIISLDAVKEELDAYYSKFHGLFEEILDEKDK